MNIYLISKCYDKNGRLLFREKRKSKSLLQNFMIVLRALFTTFSTSTSPTSAYHYYPVRDFEIPNIRQLDGTLTTLIIRISRVNTGEIPLGIYGVDAPGATDSYGIIVGTGTLPVRPDDFNLQSKISHGTGSGQLVYGVCRVGEVIVTPNRITLDITREFTNNSGSTITIREVGLISRFRYSGSNADITRFYLITRDVIADGWSVPNNSTITIAYRFESII